MPTPSRVQKGDAAVLFLASLLTEAGLVVLQPLCEALPFDLAIIYKAKLYRLQIKRAQKDANNRFYIPLRKTTVNSKGWKVYRYDRTHTDFICGVVMPGKAVYCFPIETITHISSSISLNPTGVVAPRGRNHVRKIDPEHYRNVITLGRERVILGSRQWS